MNLKEAKAMEGTEFDYIFSDGDKVRAYVKKFDPEVGLTCLSLATETEQGWKPTSKKVLEEDGTFCVVGDTTVDASLETLEEIERTGEYHVRGASGSFDGCAFN